MKEDDLIIETLRGALPDLAAIYRFGSTATRLRFETAACSAYARLNEERRAILEQIRKEGTVYGR